MVRAISLRGTTPKFMLLLVDRCVYIRDRHSSVATGRPYIIIDAFTDVELPEPDDFEAGEDAELFLESVKLAMLGMLPNSSPVGMNFTYCFRCVSWGRRSGEIGAQDYRRTKNRTPSYDLQEDAKMARRFTKTLD